MPIFFLSDSIVHALNPWEHWKHEQFQCPNLHFDGATVASGRSAYFFRTLLILSYLLNRRSKCSTFWIYISCLFSVHFLCSSFFFIIFLFYLFFFSSFVFFLSDWIHLQYNHLFVFHFLLIQSIHIYFNIAYEIHLHSVTFERYDVSLWMRKLNSRNS